jgi:uracil-DNA glycosylase family 4
MTLADLNATIPACTRCPRLREYCQEVARAKKREFRDWEYWGRPVPGFGDPDARLLIVGLAPAAHGANRTGRMFTGDSSGNWLYAALFHHGFANQPESVSRNDSLQLRDCYLGAAARCAPPDNKPTPAELANCRPYLEAELKLLRNLRVVVVLGRIAWESYLKTAKASSPVAGEGVGGEVWWARLKPAERPPFGHGREHRLPDGVTLLSSFHPSRQNTNTGKLTREMWYAIFNRAREVTTAPRGGARNSAKVAGLSQSVSIMPVSGTARIGD